jgi:hypothetical protein
MTRPRDLGTLPELESDRQVAALERVDGRHDVLLKLAGRSVVELLADEPDGHAVATQGPLDHLQLADIAGQSGRVLHKQNVELTPGCRLQDFQQDRQIPVSTTANFPPFGDDLRALVGS